MKLALVRLAAVGFVGTMMYPGMAKAQEAPQSPPVIVEKTSSQATGPSMMMVGSGIGIFALSYVPVVVVGATSGLSADQNLFVPIAGPWIDFAQRPGCPADTLCNTENTNKVLLAVDGVFQGIGALTIVGGFLNTAHETKTVRRTANSAPTLHLAPTRLGSGGYGVTASGSF